MALRVSWCGGSDMSGVGSKRDLSPTVPIRRSSAKSAVHICSISRVEVGIKRQISSTRTPWVRFYREPRAADAPAAIFGARPNRADRALVQEYSPCGKPGQERGGSPKAASGLARL
jgi:hypothetical protein